MSLLPIDNKQRAQVDKSLCSFRCLLQPHQPVIFTGPALLVTSNLAFISCPSMMKFEVLSLVFLDFCWASGAMFVVTLKISTFKHFEWFEIWQDDEERHCNTGSEHLLFIWIWKSTNTSWDISMLWHVKIMKILLRWDVWVVMSCLSCVRCVSWSQ